MSGYSVELWCACGVQERSDTAMQFLQQLHDMKVQLKMSQQLLHESEVQVRSSTRLLHPYSCHLTAATISSCSGDLLRAAAAAIV